MNPQHQQALYHYADQYGVPRNIAMALVRQESGGRPNARSPVGAMGYTQLMPGTARGLGVNPANPLDNLRGGMMYLGHLIKAFNGNIRLALAGYNAGPAAVKRAGGIPPFAETQNYVKSILAMAGPGQNNRQFTSRRLAAVNSRLPGTRTGAPDLPSILAMTQPSDAAVSMLGRLGGTAARAAEGASAPIPLPASATGGGQGIPLPGSNTLPAVGIGGKGVSVAPGANRAGIGLHQDILNFASSVAGVFGQHLTITTGTNHNQYVLTRPGEARRQSAHWTGEAADIAAKGAKLTRLGQAALIAAGADPNWAHKQKGGLFNIGGYQVIFNSMEGGNHYNHLHIGIKGHG